MKHEVLKKRSGHAASEGTAKTGADHAPGAHYAAEGKSQANQEEQGGTVGVTIRLRNRANWSVHFLSNSLFPIPAPCSSVASSPFPDDPSTFNQDHGDPAIHCIGERVTKRFRSRTHSKNDKNYRRVPVITYCDRVLNAISHYWCNNRAIPRSSKAEVPGALVWPPALLRHPCNHLSAH